MRHFVDNPLNSNFTGLLSVGKFHETGHNSFITVNHILPLEPHNYLFSLIV